MKIAEKVKEFFHNEGIHSTTIQPEFIDYTDIPTSSRAQEPNNDDCVLDCPRTDDAAGNCVRNTCCGPSKNPVSKIVSFFYCFLQWCFLESIWQLQMIKIGRYTNKQRISIVNIRRLIRKWEKPVSVIDGAPYVHQGSVRSAGNITWVEATVTENRPISIRLRSLQRILLKDFHLHSFKNQLTQTLKLTDHSQLQQFVNWLGLWWIRRW